MAHIVFQKALSKLSHHPDRGAYALCREVSPYLRTDVCPHTPLTEDQLQSRGVIMLSQMALNTWQALKSLLPGNTLAFEALRRNCFYEDVVSGNTAHSLLPLAIVARDFQPYIPAGTDSEYFNQAFCREDALAYWRQGQFEYTEERLFDQLDRVSTILLGSGYTKLCRPDDGASEYQWELVRLSNGDSLLLAGLSWFND